MSESPDAPKRPIRPDHSKFSLWKLPFAWLEYCLEWIAYAFSQWAIFKIAEYLAKLSVFVAIVAFVVKFGAELAGRDKQRVIDAYNVLSIESPPSLRQMQLDILLSSLTPDDGGYDLRGLQLQNLNLHGTDLDYAKLQETNLTASVLTDVHLYDAQLEKARLAGTDLSGADLTKANLAGAKFYNANDVQQFDFSKTSDKTVFVDADLRGALLRGVDLSSVDLTGADLRGARLEGMPASGSFPEIKPAALSGAKLLRAKLSGANLSGVDLTDADLQDAILAATQPQEGNPATESAQLSDAIFTRAKLTGADLRGVDLTNTHGLTAFQIETAMIDEATLLPADLREERGK